MPSEGRWVMNRKLVTQFVFAFATACLIAPQANAAQPTGHYGQTTGNCDCNCDSEVSCFYKHWRCMYGQMVNDGTGGTFRLYGYPKPPCCCRQPCGYPYWGMGNACFPECYGFHGCHHRCPPSRAYPTNSFGSRLPSRINGAVMAWCAAPPVSCSGAESDCQIVQAKHRTVQTKTSTLPRSLKLASSPSPIRLTR